MTECVALIRGINVGRAKRIAMAELRDIFVGLGHQNVRTLLNSGNVLFECARPTALAAIVHENPLPRIAVDPARHLVAFVAHPRSLASLRPLMLESWTPDALAIGSQAAYL